MKKILKIIGIILLVIIALIVLLTAKVVADRSIQAKDQALMVKSDDALIGTHMYIERGNEKNIDLNWYQVDGLQKYPLVINLHGGAFIAGDADTLDTQSDRISKQWNANIATINYSLLQDGMTKDDVVKEITDTVRYFIANAEAYHVNIDEIYMMGYSAGGYYAMASVLQLHSEGITIRGQILCYAFLGDILEKYDVLTDAQKCSVPPALFIWASNDPLSDALLDYERVLKQNGVVTNSKKYAGTTHGFIEENNPEYEQLHDKNKTSKSLEQEKLAREAETYIGGWLKLSIK